MFGFMGKYSPGRVNLKTRTYFKYGVYARYLQNTLIPKILLTKPCGGWDNPQAEIHVLTSKGDWLNLIWVLKSLYRVIEEPYKLCIHEDGSLNDGEINTLKWHFPGARVIYRAESDAAVNARLEEFPLSKELRSWNNLSLKVFDFATFLDAERMFLLDSDILFFEKPVHLLNCINDKNYQLNTLNKDWVHGYTLSAEKLSEETGLVVPDLINSGLGLIHKNNQHLADYEEFLNIPEMIGHPHRIEQTLVALSCANAGFEFLPKEYDVEKAVRKEGVVKHYTGPIRKYFFTSGVKRLCNMGILD